MADEIVTRCANLKLTEDDANIVALDDGPEITEDPDLSLFGGQGPDSAIV